MKRTIKKVITGSKFLLRVLNRAVTDMPRILMYHRFASPGGRNPHRLNADEFAWQLDTICRDFKVITLAECMDYFNRHGAWPKKSVVLTIDDGYRDMYDWAYPELLKRKLAATFFVTTRFIDGDIWLWPDRLEYAINNTTHKFISVSNGETPRNFSLKGSQQRALTWKAFSDYCISISNPKKEDFIREVEAMLKVVLPPAPPPEYSASTWDELSEMQQNGIEIGAHTMNHPILSQIEFLFLDGEIAGSKIVIEERLDTKIQSFCYPNGMPDDINAAVVSAVKKAGFNGAVIASNSLSFDAYRLPRMNVSNDRKDFLWKIYGGESITAHRKTLY